MKTIRIGVFIILAAAFLFIAQAAWGQGSTSSITGTVTDASGAVIADAKVSVKNEGTGVSYDTVTTSAGAYTVASLAPGLYTVTVVDPGFRTYTTVHNVLNVGAPIVIDIKLEVGEVGQTVEVEATYERLDTSNATLGGVVGRREVADLPLNGRNPLNLVIMEPGLVQRSNNAAGSDTHVFGSRDRAHNVTVDGIDANESSVPNPQSNILRLTTDNVQEYRVVTQAATAETGRNSGANVSVATRSGTNDLHGDVFYFHRNTVLNANEWFSNASKLAKPILLLHQYGLDLGGPIFKDKTFFFVSWQGNGIKQSLPIAQSFGIPRVYTASMKAGIFRYVVGTVTANGQNFTANSPGLVDASGNLLPSVAVCGGSVTTNCVASYNIFDPANDPNGIGVSPDPSITALVNTLPLPNTFAVGAGDGLNTGGYSWNVPSRFKGPFLMFRLDHKFNEKNDIFGRVNFSDYDTTEGDLLNGRPMIFPGFPPMGEVIRRNENVAIRYRRVFSPALVNEAIAGLNRFRFRFTFGESNPNLGDPVKDPAYGQQCVIQSFRNINTPFCNSPHTARTVTAWQYVDNLTYIRGAHTLRAGINFRFYQHNDSRGLAGGGGLAPNIYFDWTERDIATPAQFSNLPVIPNPTDNAFLHNVVNELTGFPAALVQTFAGSLGTNSYPAGLLSEQGTRAKQYDSYIQDEWKFRRNLTITAGLRWEWNRPVTDCCGRVFVPDKPVTGSQGVVSFVPATSWYSHENGTALGPRVSLAWDPGATGKSVIRAGYGIYFDTLSTFQVTAIGGKVPGITQTCKLSVATGITPGCTLPASGVTSRISQGFPLSLSAPTTQPSLLFSPPPAPGSTAISIGAFDPNLKVPTVHEWDLTIQRELPAKFVGQIGYVGKRGMRLYRAYDVNQFDTSSILGAFQIAQMNLRLGCQPSGTGCPAGVTAAGTPTALLNLVSSTFLNSNTTKSNLRQNGLGDLAVRIDNLLSPSPFRPNSQFGQIFYMDSGGSSIFHGMIVQLKRQYEKGLTFGLSYTFSKSIDDMSVDPVGASSGGALSTTNSRTATDVRNFALDRSRSDFDNRHVFVANFLFDLPIGRGHKLAGNLPGYLNRIAGGWSVAGIYIRQSGEPFTLNSGIRTVHNTKQSRAQIIGPLPNASSLQNVPGVVGPVVINATSLSTTTNCRQVVNSQTFICIPQAGEFGSGRNSIQGPGFSNTDLSLLKKIEVTERINMQLRAEFFNVFNHPSFENPRNATVGSPTLTSSNFGRTCCITLSTPSSATVIALGEPNRVIQFALKVSF